MTCTKYMIHFSLYLPEPQGVKSVVSFKTGCELRNISLLEGTTAAGADTGGVDRVDIHPPFFSKKKFEMSLYLK